jgi:serine/threonine-protein kinase
MSPEQARGGPVDARTDIWAFGCVLWELVTGRPAFARGTTADTLAAVVDKEPDWSAWPGGVSDSLHRLVALCLMKDPRRRLRDIGDARVILEDTAVPQPVKTSRWPRLAALLVIVLMAVAAGYGVRGLGVGPTPSTSRVTRMTIALEVADWVGLDRPAIALSPNGDSLVYVARGDGPRHLNVRRFDAFEARAIEGSESAAAPFFDPSGRWIGFVADRTLKKTSVAGGRPITVAKVADVPLGAAWLPDGSIVLGSINGSGLTRVPAEGGDPQTWPTPPPAGVAEAWPQTLPDGSAVLFTSFGGAGEPWFVDVLAVATGARKRLLEGASAFFVSTGHLVFMRGAAVMAVRFDPNRLEPTGEPVTLIENVQRAASTGAAQLSVSTTGDLVYVPDLDAEPRRLMLVQRDGRATSIAPPARPYVTLRISPNGQRIAASVGSGSGQNIWVYDVPRKAWSQLTFNGGATPIWTRDGTHVTFARRGQIYWKAADGTGPEVMLNATPASPHSWAPDGSALLAVGQDGVFVLPVAARGSLGEPREYMREATTALMRARSWVRGRDVSRAVGATCSPAWRVRPPLQPIGGRRVPR